MAKLSTDELLDAFNDLTLIELSEFLKKFEDRFEVTVAMHVALERSSYLPDAGR